MSGLILEQAQNLLLERVNMIKDAEEITLWDAARRVLAKDIYAEHDQPRFQGRPLTDMRSEAGTSAWPRRIILCALGY